MSIAQTEAVLLTGGASRRMGRDKSLMEVAGRPMADRIGMGLVQAGLPVTVLGREPLEGFSFLRDREELAGPLAALAGFAPRLPFVFVVACDLPFFDPAVVGVLEKVFGKSPAGEAVVPVIGEKLQPACALYRSNAWAFLPDLLAQGKRSLMAWLESLNMVRVTEAELAAAGIAPHTLAGANTPEDFARLLGRGD